MVASNSFLYKRIDKRVGQRLKLGLVKEIKNLLTKYKWSDPGLNTLAYKEFKEYFLKTLSLNEVTNKWRFDEHAYARRQLTWFKKIKANHYLNIENKKLTAVGFNLTARWYNKP